MERVPSIALSDNSLNSDNRTELDADYERECWSKCETECIEYSQDRVKYAIEHYTELLDKSVRTSTKITKTKSMYQQLKQLLSDNVQMQHLSNIHKQLLNETFRHTSNTDIRNITNNVKNTLRRYLNRLLQYKTLIDLYIHLAESNELFQIEHPPHCVYESFYMDL